MVGIDGEIIDYYIYEEYGPAILKEVLHHYAGKDNPEMMPAIRKWYLLEAISWTIQKCMEQNSADIKHGLNEITRELATLSAQYYADGDAAT